MSDEGGAPPAIGQPEAQGLSRSLIPEVVDLAQIRLPFAQVDPTIRPRAADPLFELGRLLGPELVCLIVAEAERIHDGRESTHIDLRLHFLQGEPRKAQWMPVRALAMGTRPPRGR